MRIVFLVFALASVAACRNPFRKSLPVIDNPIVTEQGDTLRPGFGNFRLLRQDSTWVSERDLKGKVTVADFFFCSCPSICPRMKTQMLRVYNQYKNDDRLILLSFTIDPQRDTVQRLKTYAQKLGVPDSRRWWFLTGDKEAIYGLAERLMIYASPDETAPGGYVHNGKFVLTDAQGKIRGYYEGTDEKSVSQLLHDMELLLP
ncbi:MAG: SCO family protein [Chitinophagales bacterium]|nr:SCO family protein [Chitinophagales bacterium]MDW8417890.1 SCO family protein [Chitinophagales bacterium]